ncbi:MAG: DUF2855 family protein [Actinomycetota bacterium]
MDILISATNLRQTMNETLPQEPLATGSVRVAINHFGLSANNITYAVMGDAMNYWQFFPYEGLDDSAPWRRMPVWGYATVTESAHDDVKSGELIFGYFPCSSSFVIEPGRIDPSGFSDVAAHRADLPSVYNRYSRCAADSSYSLESEPIDMLLKPLFTTSFVVHDYLVDNDHFGASTAVLSSASSKTAIGVAILLAEAGAVRVVGLTSPSNVAFCKSLGCYDEVLTYDDVEKLSLDSSVYLDVAGRRDVTNAIHHHLGDKLGWSMIIGDTHWEATSEPTGPLPGPRPTLLFAPVQIAKRRQEWGREGFEQALASAWGLAKPIFEGFIKFESLSGPDAITAAYLELLEGSADPTTGWICSLLT